MRYNIQCYSQVKERIMEQKKARKAGIMDILRSPYAHQFFRKYKWSYLLGMAILIVIDSAQTEVPRIVG